MSARLRLLPASPAGTEPVGSIGVVLAEDHALLRRLLRLVLDREPDIHVLAEAADRATMLACVDAHRPHVLLLDMGFADGHAASMISELRARAPAVQIVALTLDDSPLVAEGALTAGALGYVLKEHADTELANAVRAAARGEQRIDPHLRASRRAVASQRP